jgi:hypothetical protein
MILRGTGIRGHHAFAFSKRETLVLNLLDRFNGSLSLCVN